MHALHELAHVGLSVLDSNTSICHYIYDYISDASIGLSVLISDTSIRVSLDIRLKNAKLFFSLVELAVFRYYI